jgi:DNA (cytosine-5)-methyltransferase 1
MRHGSLFSGIGGFDLAAEWMGWENVFHCEWNEFGQRVLKHHFPKADSYSDITKTDFRKYEGTIDIISGGFPCQPFSLAGKRKGTDDERYLWHEMLRAIQEIKPKFVIAENVYGIVNIDGGLVFEQVCADLEDEGYEVQPFIIPAAAKNAPHRRDRVWFVAIKNTLHGRCLHGGNEQERTEVRKFGDISTRSSDWIRLSEGDATNTESKRLEGGRFQERPTNDATYTERIGRIEVRDDDGQPQKSQQAKRREQQFSRTDSAQNWWREFPSQSPICSGDDGLPSELDGITFPKWRNESIKAYGNAIVPQVAFTIFKAICTIS